MTRFSGDVHRRASNVRRAIPGGPAVVVPAGERPRAVSKGPFKGLHVEMTNEISRDAAEAAKVDMGGSKPELLLNRFKHDPLLERICSK